MVNSISESIIISMYTFYSIISNKLYLPPEIITLIYSFVLIEHYRKIIYKHCYNSTILSKLIKYITINVTGENIDTIIESSNIDALRIIINSHIPRKYSLNFWAHYLQVLSTNINRLRFSHRVNNISFRSVNGKKLKLLLDLWLQLCKKFNLKIFLQTKNFSKYIRAKYILKIKNYDQYLISPIIIQPFTHENWINYDQAIEFLNNRLVII
uniref:Uncharacterized protein n=1 Tax=viral metagenome TaxID=1070528 RepID=A0A6C0AXY4_9ZZZZ